MIERLLILCVSIASLSLTAGLALTQTWSWIPLPLLWPFLWLIGHRRKWVWIADAAFAVYGILAIICVWLEVHPWWVLVGIISTLSAWDSAGFLQRVSASQSQAETRQLSYGHLRRVLPVMIAGFSFAALTLNLDITLDFSGILLLGIIAILTISRMIGFLRRVSD